MNFVLDTNIVLFYLKDEKTKNYIEGKYAPFGSGNNPIISVVTVGEIRALALMNNWGEKRIKIVEEFINELVIVDIRFNDLINAYAEIDAFSQGKLKYKNLGNSSRNMGKNDLWIAATAHVTKSTLLTSDKDFEHLDKVYLDLICLNR